MLQSMLNFSNLYLDCLANVSKMLSLLVETTATSMVSNSMNVPLISYAPHRFQLVAKEILLDREVLLTKIHRLMVMLRIAPIAAMLRKLTGMKAKIEKRDALELYFLNVEKIRCTPGICSSAKGR